MHSILSLKNSRYITACLCLVFIVFSDDWLRVTLQYGAFSLLGVVGAIFANSTGAGGGVVFVPFFNQLNFDPATTVATSFAIQCCGMTAGAITWYLFYLNEQKNNVQWRAFSASLRLSVPCSIAGIAVAQGYQYLQGGLGDAVRLHTAFGVFSIVLALGILFSVNWVKKASPVSELLFTDKVGMSVTAFCGGVITAWLSVGVGELIAVLLILRGFNAAFAIAVAVIVSAFSVWSAMPYHLIITHSVHWEVVAFAGIGAVTGGVVAKHLTLFFSPVNLKIFFAVWVMVLGLVTLPF